MTRQELADASASLESAARAATDEDAVDRLRDLAGQLETLADRDQAPDHGRLARIEIALDELTAEVGDDAATRVDTADEHVKAFRETIEGV